MRERKLEADCRVDAREAGMRLPKWTSPGNAGVPDRILLSPAGHVVFCEFKTQTSLTPAQAMWRRWLTEHGHDYELIRSRDQFGMVLARVSKSRR